ncbi:MAG: tRNA lysidine(34) synthetase TilS, partial [Flavobacteriales bacterium]
MRNAVAALLAQHGLAPPAKMLVAVSGGVDSVVLAHVLGALGFDLALAHVNYGLRGADSDADQAFVEALGAAWDVPVHVNRADLEPGANIQLAARNIRYVWFEELQTTHGFDWVATGHHAHDHLETVLFRLMRGTGNAGLVGIPVVRDRIVRPLR